MNLDSQSFNNLFSEYRNRFIRFAESYLKDRFLAEDMFVDSMMALWQNRTSLPDDTNAPSYVLTVLKNKCIDYLRRRRLDKDYCDQKTRMILWELDFRISSLEHFIPDEVFSHEIQIIIKETMEGLSDVSRKIFFMSRSEGKSGKEIASELGISEKGVEYHITKINKILRLKLKDYLTISVIIFYLL